MTVMTKITYKGTKKRCFIHPWKDIIFEPGKTTDVPEKLYKKIEHNPEFEKVGAIPYTTTKKVKE